MSFSEFSFRDWLNSIMPDPLWEEFKKARGSASFTHQPNSLSGEKNMVDETATEQMPEGLQVWRSTFSDMYNDIKKDLIQSSNDPGRGAKVESTLLNGGQQNHQQNHEYEREQYAEPKP